MVFPVKKFLSKSVFGKGEEVSMVCKNSRVSIRARVHIDKNKEEVFCGYSSPKTRSIKDLLEWVNMPKDRGRYALK